MKKSIIYIVTVILIISIVTGCGSLLKGEEQMEEQLMAKEELLTFIEENQNLETVDITVDDLKDIDVDAYIRYWHFRTIDDIQNVFLRRTLESYLASIESQNRAAYMAQELLSVESTDEEYEKFKEVFISSVDGHLDYKGKEYTYLDLYYTYYNGPDGEETWEYLYIGQTKYLNQFSTEKYNDARDIFGYYKIHLPVDSEGLTYVQGFCYNKNQKYFMVTYQFEPFFDMIKIFTAME